MTISKILFNLRHIAYSVAALSGLRDEPGLYNIGYLDKAFIIRANDRFRVRDSILRNLRANGFFTNVLAYRYQNEILNMRRIDPKDRDYQIHIRIYIDGRVTGHYETTHDHPIEHMYGYGLRPLTTVEWDFVNRILWERA